MERKGGEFLEGRPGQVMRRSTNKMSCENTGCHNELVIDDLQRTGFIKMMGREIVLLGDKFLPNISSAFKY